MSHSPSLAPESGRKHPHDEGTIRPEGKCREVGEADWETDMTWVHLALWLFICACALATIGMNWAALNGWWP
jgi:hypothetical protein